MGLTEYLQGDNLINLERVKTGDILLFTNEPKKGSLLIMIATKSVWVHVGIAVWSESSPRRLLVFESTRGKVAEDELTGEIRRGVRLTDIRNITNEYQAIHVRPVDLVRDEVFYTKLNDFIQLWKGVDYVNLIKIPLIPFICFEDTGISCSELVARYFQYMGFFEGELGLEEKCIKNFLPLHFAPGSEFNQDVVSFFLTTKSPLIYHKGFLQTDTINVLIIIAIILFVVMMTVHLQESKLFK
jgi:hypothetical protein